MKIKTISLLALAATLAFLPALRAQESTTPPAKHPARKAGAGGPRGEQAKERLDKLASELNLSDEQKREVAAAMKDQAEQRRELRDATPDERRAKAKALREEMDAKMKKILNPDQYQKWLKLREDMRPGRGNPPAKPEGKASAESN
jgi:Spy/CpxP family protein refolding chaperone